MRTDHPLLPREAAAAHDLHSSGSAQDTALALALGVILAKRNKVKGALIFLNQPYEGRNDKLHWLGIDLFIWIVDKFYMPVATASCSLIADGNNLWPLVGILIYT
jgi:hypothetical protein